MKRFSLFLLLISISFIMVSCHHDKEEDERNSYVAFNISNSQALGQASSGRFVTASRAATGVDGLVKINQNGNILPAITVEGENISTGTSLQSIVKSPYTDDVYFLYDGATFELTSPSIRLLDPLVCVHSDGSFTNLTGHSTQFSDDGYLIIENENCLVFDESGILYFLARESGGWENYVMKYNPKTDDRETIFSAVTDYLSDDIRECFSKLMISKDGRYLYVGGFYPNDSQTFVRVVDLESDGKYEEISSDPESSLEWVYDKYEDRLIVFGSKDNKNKIKQYTKAGDDLEKLLGENISCSSFIPSEKGVWAFSREWYGEGQTLGNFLVNLDNIGNTGERYHLGEATDGFSIGDPFNRKFYQIVGDYIYIQLYGYDSDTDKTIYQYFRFNMKDNTFENVLKNSDYTDLLDITSWSVNSTSFYYSGTYSSENIPINGKVDVSSSDFTHTKMDSSQILTCLSAM